MAKQPNKKATRPKELPPGQLIREKGRRPIGRPKRGAPALNREQIELIGVLYLRSVPIQHIADRLGVHKNAISHHLDNEHRPRWRARMAERFEEEIARVEYLERIAWERFDASMQPETVREVRETLGAMKDGKPEPSAIQKIKRKIGKNGNVAYLELILRIRDYFAKVGGYYQTDPLGAETQEQRPVIANILITTQDEARRVLKFEDLQRAAAQNALPGAEILDAKFQDSDR